MKLLLIWVGLVGVVFAQTPDCAQVFDFTATSATASVPNVQVGCTGWTMVYESTGFSAVTLEFQSSDGSTAPLAFVTYTGTVVTGSNPATSTVGGPGAAVNFKGYVGFWRVSATVTGTGRLRGTLLGYRPGFTNAAGGGGGGGGSCGMMTGPLCYQGPSGLAAVVNSAWDPSVNTLTFVEPVSMDLMLTFSNDSTQGDSNGTPIFAINDDFTAPPGNGLFGMAIHLNAVQGGNGTDTTNSFGGDGGEFNVFAGDGGRGFTGSNRNDGGTGGELQIIAGFGGGAHTGMVNEAIGGNGGEVFISGGDGGGTNGQGMTDVGGDGGIVEIVPGQGAFGVTRGMNGTIYLESAGGVSCGAPTSDDIVKITSLFGGTTFSRFECDGRYVNRLRTFAQLGTEVDAMQVYCTDCAVTGPIDNTCTSGGTGAMAFGINGVFKCLT